MNEINDQNPAAHADLTAENLYFETLFESVQEAIVILNRDRTIRRVNPEFTRLFGYSEAESVGFDLDELVAPLEYVNEAVQISQSVSEGHSPVYSVEGRRRKKSGAFIDVSVIGAPILVNGMQVAAYVIYRDISSRKQAESDLLREKAYLDQLVKSASEGIALCDNEGNIIRVNSEFCRIFQYSEKELIGRNIDEMVAPPDWTEEARSITGNVGQGETFSKETVRMRKDGSLIQVSVIGSPIVVDGRLVATYGIYRDITDRKQAEEAFRLEKAYLEQLVNTAPEAIVLGENNGRIIRVNSEFTRLFGFSEAEVRDQMIDDLISPPGMKEAAKAITHTVSEGERFSLETIRRHKSGRLINVSLIGSPIVIDGHQVATYGIYRDITDRKRAEESFQREKAFLEQLVESAQEGIVILDPNGFITKANSEFLRMFGYTDEEALNHSIDDLIIPFQQMKEAKALTKTATQGRPFALETRRRRKDGTLIDVSVIGSPIVVDGHQVATYGIYRDITEEKRAEAALLESEKRFRDLFENVPVGLFQTTADGKYINANTAHRHIFGYPDLETLNTLRADSFYVNPKDRKKFKKKMEKEDVVQSMEMHYRRFDGTPFWARESVHALRDEHNRIAMYEGVIEDITAWKKAEEAFQREKAYLDQLVESAPEAIILTDQTGNVLRVNSEFGKIFQYSAAEAIGKPIDELVTTPELRAEGVKFTSQLSEGKKLIVETQRKRKDGSLIHVSVIGAPIIIEDEESAVFAIYRDITERKEAEKQILENRQLVIEANRSLQERTRQLEELNRMLERLSNLDGLTGIPNRRYFEHFYDLEWRRARRENQSISVIMIDVDFFKNFNDAHGHLAGDECLKKIADTLQVVNRAGDVVARYGGEEFVVVLPSTDMVGALHLAEIMRQRILDLHIRHQSSIISDFVTISLGIATQQPESEIDPMTLLLNADQALYQAKLNGRNRIEFLGSK